MGSEQVFVYVPEDQYSEWEAKADDMGMNMSDFVKANTEAGLKKFDRDVEPDETNRELRTQRNELRDELDRARDRIQELEDRLYHGEPAEIERFVRDNPGATYDEIVQQIIDTAAGRVTKHLDDMEGDELRVDDGEYYPAEDDDGGRS